MPRFATILPGCLAGAGPEEPPPMTGRARASRLLAGLGFLALATWLWAFACLGGLPLTLVAVIPAWFGVSHVLAGALGYPGCPELGAVPTLLLRRPVATTCTAWRLIDRAIDRACVSCRPSAG